MEHLLDPFFHQCLQAAAANKELVKEFDRLNNTNLSMVGKPLEIMIDNATGRMDDAVKEFVEFVKFAIYEPLRIQANAG